MKTLFTLLILFLLSFGLKAQMSAVVDFEADDDAALWSVFSNGANGTADDFTIVDNPSPNSVNSSAKVLQFVVHPDASAWVGAYSDSYGPITFTDDAHILVMSVLKTVVSPCDIKVETSTDGGQNQEFKVSNTLTDEWELLTFDLSAAIGHTYNRLTIFPDFPDARTDGTTVFLDNISAATSVGIKNLKALAIKTYPNPVDKELYVQQPGMKSISISNLSGQLICSYRFPAAGSKTITIPDIKPGIYIISVETENRTFTSKITKR